MSVVPVRLICLKSRPQAHIIRLSWPLDLYRPGQAYMFFCSVIEETTNETHVFKVVNNHLDLGSVNAWIYN